MHKSCCSVQLASLVVVLFLYLRLHSNTRSPLETMTRPKKWYVEKEGTQIILCNRDGAMKKPNASHSLGGIQSVSLPTEEMCGKYSVSEAVLVCLFAIVTGY